MSKPTILFRVDDVYKYTPALARLFALCQSHQVFLNLEIIPARLQMSLVDFLEDSQNFEAHQHGFNHENCGSQGENCEFAEHVDPALKTKNVKRGFKIVRPVPNFSPFFSFPWNVVDRSILPVLATMGFWGYGSFGKKQTINFSQDNLVEVSPQIDIFLAREVPNLFEMLINKVDQRGSVGLTLHVGRMRPDDWLNLRDLVYKIEINKVRTVPMSYYRPRVKVETTTLSQKHENIKA